jgi:uncharacterized protein (DUF433 family)
MLHHDLDLAPEPLPLRVDDTDTVRVGRTRVTLDLLIGAFQFGKSPEEIAHSFNTLDLADVYTVIGYYLRHRAEVDAYLERREREAAAFQEQMEALFPPDGLRERLLARRAASKPAS